MLYDIDRTRAIVDRLVLVGNNLRGVLILANAVLFAALLGILSTLMVGGAFGLIVALIGAVAGGMIGAVISSALSAVLEWMAQVLISIQPRE